MADYRELLRRAIDALPENTGANRRAVYEKARGALVAQLRAIDPPLPAREITTHRLNLEDCIRQVEQEATDRLLGRLRPDEAEPAAERQAPAPTPETGPGTDDSGPDSESPGADTETDNSEDTDSGQDAIAQQDDELATGPASEDETVQPDTRKDTASDDRFDEPVLVPASEPAQSYTVAEASSIEDIIAAAETAREPSANDSFIAEAQAGSEPEPVLDDAPPVRADVLVEPDLSPEPDAGKHFIKSARNSGSRSDVPLVDIHGRPLGSANERREPSPGAVIGAAMSSVREVDVDAAPQFDPEVSDAQVAIDRAIAALDREARGENSELDDDGLPTGDADGDDADETDEVGSGRSGGVGALTVFLLLSVLLLGGGGAAGYWAWREGFIDLNTIFAQSTPAEPSVEVAETEEPLLEVVPDPSGNTTTEVPATPGINGEAMPGEELPFVETETPSSTGSDPEIAFEDRLPAEAGESLNGNQDVISEEEIEAAASGPQSLLLEEQSSGAVGAVPYSGSVEWSRGSDELGHPTIIAEATIPARNLDLRMLIRRNADTNLPASHLMEINFTLAESFVGGTIANLPGVLLKDEELVQGQPLTGASARIVGNSFLFALSSASERDVENNVALLRDRAWVDLAMVYGTGRRAILTLEKSSEGEAIFDAVMDAWAELDAEAQGEAASQ